MPRDFLSQSASHARTRGSSRWTLPISVLAHVAVIAALLVGSLITPLASPAVRQRLDVFLPKPPPLPDVPPPPRPAGAHPPEAVPSTAAIPRDVPEGISPEKESPARTDVGAVVGADPGVIGGVDGGLFTSSPPLPAPPPPPVAAPRTQEAPRPVGGDIKAPERLSAVPPTYPPIAQSARIEGDVILEAVIGVDGRVRDLRVLRSVPLLDEAAIDAVKRWRYTPTRLNGVPVPVIMTVTVRFRLH